MSAAAQLIEGLCTEVIHRYAGLDLHSRNSSGLNFVEAGHVMDPHFQFGV